MQKTTPRGLKALPHGIDITAPGGIDELIAFHRETFGDARMEASTDGDDGGADEGEQPSGADEQRGADQDKGAKRALESERTARRQAEKDLGAANARIKELEDAGKSEEQRREDASKEMVSENQSLKSQVEQKDALLLRYEVAADKGLDLAAAKRLQGSTREEIEADAADWIARWGSGAGSGQTPPPDPGQGPRPNQKESSFAQGTERARARFGGSQQ